VCEVDSRGEHLCDLRRLVGEHVGVHPKGDRGVGVAQASRHDVHGYACLEEQGGVDVSQVVESHRWERALGVLVVEGPDPLAHDLARVGRGKGASDLQAKDVVAFVPGTGRHLAFFSLVLLVRAQHINGARIEGHPTGSPTLRRSFDSVSSHDGGRSSDDDGRLRTIEVDVRPPQVEQFATTCTREGRKPIERKQPVRLHLVEEGGELRTIPHIVDLHR
jgi:hypothetical protein